MSGATMAAVIRRVARFERAGVFTGGRSGGGRRSGRVSLGRLAPVTRRRGSSQWRLEIWQSRYESSKRCTSSPVGLHRLVSASCVRMGAHDAHYAGELVDGARILALFGDVATELLIRLDGDEGLFRAYEIGRVSGAGLRRRLHRGARRFSRRSATPRGAWSSRPASRSQSPRARASRIGRRRRRAAVVVCRARGTCVVPEAPAARRQPPLRRPTAPTARSDPHRGHRRRRGDARRRRRTCPSRRKRSPTRRRAAAKPAPR